ncbi:MAG: hypothetical protein ACTS27_11305 [Phycisphaerales bacterium]
MANLPRLHTPDEATDPHDALAPIPFERRADNRATAGGSMQGVIASGVDMPVLIRLQLVDASATGLGALASSPVPVGSRISLRVDPVHGVWKTATVVRCVECQNGSGGAGGHRVGLAYAHKRAA